MISSLFVRAVYEMLDNGEFERVETYLRKIEDEEQADFVKGLAAALRKEPKRFPFLPLLVGCRSDCLLQDVIVRMIRIEEAEKKGEEDDHVR